MTRRAIIGLWFGIGAFAAACVAVMVAPVLVRGVSARDEPTAVESFVARNMRRFAVPRAMRRLKNPVPGSAEIVAAGRAHFADHCATCHGNDGRGRTTIGQNLYPKAPDMTLPATQDLSDGELFAIIENGVRLTGMPAWGTPSPDDDSQTWHLVHFIRHLPGITPEELETMEELNPLSKQQWKEQEEAERFLRGDDEPAKQPR